MTIYLDHQASTPILRSVWEVMLPFWEEFHGNPHSSEHMTGWAASKAVEKARTQLAKLVGADTDEVFFTSGATEANNLALKGLSLGQREKTKRSKILVSAVEHKCILESAAYVQHAHNFDVAQVPVDQCGYANLDRLEELLTEDVFLVSIALVNNEIGTIQNAEAISNLCSTTGAIFHSDFAQAPSATVLSSYANVIDAISISGHKFGGPMGIGALYLSRELQDKIVPLFHGGGQELGIRAGTLPLPLCVGLGSAAEFTASENGAASRKQVSDMRDAFVQRLRSKSNKIELNGETLAERHPGNANLKLIGYNASEILQRLQPKLSASTGSACSTGTTEPSYVLRAIGLDIEGAQSSIRFSFGHTNTMEEAHLAADVLLELL